MNTSTPNRMWRSSALETDIVERVKHGDITAFAELYALYRLPVHALCMRLTRDVLDAEDLTQEVFLRVYRKVNSFRGEAAFGTWLYRVATNVTMMHLRRRHLQEIPLDDLEHENVQTGPTSRIGRRDHTDPITHIALLRALGGLSKNRRALVFLHDIKGLTHNEVAQSIGVTASTSRSRLYEAHQELREIMQGADMQIHRSPSNILQNLSLRPTNND